VQCPGSLNRTLGYVEPEHIVGTFREPTPEQA